MRAEFRGHPIVGSGPFDSIFFAKCREMFGDERQVVSVALRNRLLGQKKGRSSSKIFCRRLGFSLTSCSLQSICDDARRP